MISTAMTSSMIARASRKTLTLTGIERPSRASTPTAKAISVAVGTAQPLAAHGIAVEAQVDQGGDNDAAGGSDDRQRRLVELAQCAFMDFAPDLHAHNKEEDCHQRVVDPEMQGLGEDELAEPDRKRQMPEGVIAVREGRVGPDQRDSRRDEQHDAADGLDMQEALKGGEGPLGQKLGSRHDRSAVDDPLGTRSPRGGPTIA